jgi:8-oxo-dGTP pyrophosphatase MutT (NUDIX family)
MLVRRSSKLLGSVAIGRTKIVVMNITAEPQYPTKAGAFTNSGRNLISWHMAHFLDAGYPGTLTDTSQTTGLAAANNPVLAWLRKLHARIEIWRFVKRQRSAFAFIAVGTGRQRRYLLQWNETWQVFNLIGGKLDNSKGDSDSLSRALQRELEEEMGLKNGEDFELGRCLKTVKMRQFSPREKKAKYYRFGVFDVALFPRLLHSISHPNYAARWLSTRYENVFVSAEEVANLKTADGRAISCTTRHVLQALGELS